MKLRRRWWLERSSETLWEAVFGYTFTKSFEDHLPKSIVNTSCRTVIQVLHRHAYAVRSLTVTLP
jgi:hypothetical protein